MLKSQYTALYGGSFDPPHLGHAHVITAVLNSGLVSSLDIVPASDNRYDKRPHATFAQRLEMLTLFVAERFPNDPRIKVLSIQEDVEALQKSYTIDTIHHLKTLTPQAKFSWIIGEDNVGTLPTWHRAGELLLETAFLVIKRPNADQASELLPADAKLEYIKMDSVCYISSTDIRKKISNFESIFSLVSPNVLRYIASSRLYLEK